MNIYAIYRGEEFLYEGTSKECAKHFNVQVKTVRWWNTKANKIRASGKRKNGQEKQRIIAIVIEENYVSRKEHKR